MRVIALLAVLAAAAPAAPDLFQSIRNGDISALRSALSQGADANAADRRGATLLMHSAAFGSADAMKLLLDAGADVNAANSFGATALVWAASEEPKVRMLVEHGAKVNVRTRLGRTPLMVAAACDGCSGIVRYLLAKGADVKVRDESGAGALQLAALAGDEESVNLLLNAGADAKAADRDGNTPLFTALEKCSAGAARALIARGADVNAKLTSAGAVKFGPIQLIGISPLHIASPYCDSSITRIMIAAHASPNVADIRGMTPLMLSVSTESGNPAKVKALLEAGADVGAKDRNGETALDWALKYGETDAAAALRAAGAKQGLPFSAPRRPSLEAPRSVPEAVTAAIALIGQSSTKFFEQSGCVGCHHQILSLAALSAAQRAGAGSAAAHSAAETFQQMIVSEWTGEQEQLLERDDPGGAPDGEAYAAWALSLSGFAPRPLTDVVAAHIAMQQLHSGNWHVGDISRSPLQEGDIARTARCLRLLQVYGFPGRKAEFEARIARARTWLQSARTDTTDDAAMQIAGLHWAGAPVVAQVKALLALQKPDGGWAQNRVSESDPYATGEALWALYESGGVGAGDPAYRRGVEYLLRTQWPDGSWYVRSRAPKIQPYFESGFPFAHDQWISAAATAWDILALLPSMETGSNIK